MAITSNASQDFVPIKEVRNGVVIMKDNSYRAILLCSSINFSLKSLDEQRAILIQFQNFLNSLDFSIQINIQSRRFDIKPYLTYLAGLEKNQINDLMRIQLREYITFVRNFTDNQNIMTKNFFVVIPYSPTIVNKKGGGIFSFGKKKTHIEENMAFEQRKLQLDERVSIVQSGLRSCGLKVAHLGTEEIIDLFYKTFNPGDTGKPIATEK